MSHASLASRYRPQTFAEVVGQDTVKGILSRAAAEDRVAPAYLLSGTRGVGKTTIARIFAKALNCAHAPAAEPCNTCPACRAITQGSYVDVVEIDGASNRGIDDARRLREGIGYAPMEGRYKLIIIDEAHMLTKEAFNALLKTLEEPPPHATFSLATTEPHKFPVTIVSRCQHFIFRAIPEDQLAAHLAGVLQRESLAFEDNAVHLLARRAAGSVRDAMSLLGQTLALGGDQLTEASVRSVLGLAGQELYERLLTAVSSGDCVGVSRLTTELLGMGVDIGFFLRELSQLWRNLFLLRQAGEAALPLIDMPDADKRRLVGIAAQFSLTAIHAAWQMTLEGQRQVLNSLEPGTALELLLLNLALTPSLASLELVSRAHAVQSHGAAGTQAGSAPAGAATSVPVHSGQAAAAASPLRAAAGRPGRAAEGGRQAAPADQPWRTAPVTERQPGSESAAVRPSDVPGRASGEGQMTRSSDGHAPVSERGTAGASAVSASTMPGNWRSGSGMTAGSGRAESASAGPGAVSAPAAAAKNAHTSAAATPQVSDTAAVAAVASGASGEKNMTPGRGIPDWPCSWKEFLAFAATQLNADTPLHLPQLQSVAGECHEDVLVLMPRSETLRDILAEPSRMDCLRRVVRACAGREVRIELRAPVVHEHNEGQLKQELLENPAVMLLQEHFDAKLLRCLPPRLSEEAAGHAGKAVSDKRNP